MIQEKPRTVQCSLNETLPIHEQTSIYLSNRWLKSVRRRNYFKCYEAYGEKSDADHAAAAAGNVPALLRLASTSSEIDVFNTNELGLFILIRQQVLLATLPCPVLRKWTDESLSWFVPTWQGRRSYRHCRWQLQIYSGLSVGTVRASCNLIMTWARKGRWTLTFFWLAAEFRFLYSLDNCEKNSIVCWQCVLPWDAGRTANTLKFSCSSCRNAQLLFSNC